MKRYYEDFCGFGRRENKANSKPIQSQFIIVQCSPVRQDKPDFSISLKGS
jgi:hypothetical protein